MKKKLILSDIDGTITDGKIYYNETGHAFKVFQERIGDAIDLLDENQINILFYTSGEKGFKISNAFTSAFEKVCSLVESLEERSNYLASIYNSVDKAGTELIYLGDGLMDYHALINVFGSPRNFPDNLFIACPLNACGEIKEIAHYIGHRSDGPFLYDVVKKMLKEL